VIREVLPPAGRAQKSETGVDGGVSEICTEDSELDQDRADLVSALRELYEARWEELTAAMVFSEVRATARELSRLASTYHSAQLSEYAGELSLMVEQFDQEGLEKKLGEFQQLVATFSTKEEESARK
jgi:hypothetical protein